MRLKNKVALITGAASKAGIGYTIAREMAAEGAIIVASDIQAPSGTIQDIEADGGSGCAVAMNVTDAENINRVMDGIWEQYGRLDILVNNAGICPGVPFLELNKEIWDATINVNLTGVFLCSLAAARCMVKAGQRGKIVIISSYCVEYPSMTQTPYAASKGGVYMLAKNMALELAPYYINVNSVAPAVVGSTNIAAAGVNILRDMGYADKAMSREALPISDKDISHDERSVLNRSLIPYDIARAVVFLTSPDADHISGQTIFVNGFDRIW